MLRYLGNDRLTQILAGVAVVAVVYLLTMGSVNMALMLAAGALFMAAFHYGRLSLGSSVLVLWLGGFAAMAILSLLRAATGEDSPPVMLVGFFVLAFAGAWSGRWRAGPLLFALGIFAFYAAVVGLSSWFGRSTPTALVYQALYDVRVLLLLLVAGAFAQQYRMLVTRIDKLALVLLLLLLPFVLVQSVLPDLYSIVFPFGDGAANPFLPFLPARAKGFFVHSSVLAQFAVFFVFWNAIQIWFRGERSAQSMLVLLGYIVVLVLSGQRQETMAACAALALLWVFAPGGRLWPRLTTAVLVLAAGLAAALAVAGGDAIYALAREWGLVANAWVWEPRAVMYQFGIKLANEYWPLGSGAGTFGSVGAAKFDQRLYFELGFMRFFWFVEGKWLMDTYWPHIFAEGGWIGLGLMCWFFVYLAWRAGRALRATSDPVLQSLFAMALAGMLFNLLNSPTSAAISDINYMWPYLPFVGLPFCRWSEREPAR
ncbi:MAG TPA: hypothetical protein VLC08_09810 [Chitinolyticbacter sp.]|nr:hypothetical protein [Chitinolyticbacter sp.]